MITQIILINSFLYLMGSHMQESKIDETENLFIRHLKNSAIKDMVRNATFSMADAPGRLFGKVTTTDTQLISSLAQARTDGEAFKQLVGYILDKNAFKVHKQLVYNRELAHHLNDAMRGHRMPPASEMLASAVFGCLEIARKKIRTDKLQYIVLKGLIDIQEIGEIDREFQTKYELIMQLGRNDLAAMVNDINQKLSNPQYNGVSKLIDNLANAVSSREYKVFLCIVETLIKNKGVSSGYRRMMDSFVSHVRESRCNLRDTKEIESALDAAFLADKGMNSPKRAIDIMIGTQFTLPSYDDIQKIAKERLEQFSILRGKSAVKFYQNIEQSSSWIELGARHFKLCDKISVSTEASVSSLRAHSVFPPPPGQTSTVPPSSAPADNRSSSLTSFSKP